MPRKITEAYVANELKVLAEQEVPSPLKSRKDVDSLVTRIRKAGLARAEGILLPGQIGMSAPIFGQDGQVVAAISITAVASADEFREGAVAVHYRKAVTAEASQRLGYDPKRSA